MNSILNPEYETLNNRDGSIMEFNFYSSPLQNKNNIPDPENGKFELRVNSDMESGFYFNDIFEPLPNLPHYDL